MYHPVGTQALKTLGRFLSVLLTVVRTFERDSVVNRTVALRLAEIPLCCYRTLTTFTTCMQRWRVVGGVGVCLYDYDMLER